MKLENHHWLMIILIIFCIGLSFYLPLVNYDLLPDPIPTHFNIYGEPDGWSSKSLINVLLGPIILSATLILMLPLTWWMAKVEDPKKIINTSKQKLEKMTIETAEEIRRITILHLLIILLLTALLILMITFNQVMVALGQAISLGSGILTIVLLLMFDCFYLTWKVMRLM